MVRSQAHAPRPQLKHTRPVAHAPLLPSCMTARESPTCAVISRWSTTNEMSCATRKRRRARVGTSGQPVDRPVPEGKGPGAHVPPPHGAGLGIPPRRSGRAARSAKPDTPTHAHRGGAVVMLYVRVRGEVLPVGGDEAILCGERAGDGRRRSTDGNRSPDSAAIRCTASSTPSLHCHKHPSPRPRSPPPLPPLFQEMRPDSGAQEPPPRAPAPASGATLSPRTDGFERVFVKHGAF